MKNTIKVLGIIAMIAIIGFSMTACEDDGGGDNGTGGGGNNGTTIDTDGTDFVAVTNITGVPTTATLEIPLTLTGTVEPETATNKIIAWSVTNGTGTATISDGNTLNPTVAGTVTVTATIANGTAQGTTYTKDFPITISIAIAPSITTESLPNGMVGTAYSQTLTATGSTPITWTLDTGSSLPAGLNLAETGVISGTPTAVVASQSFTVKADNAIGSDTKQLSITIVAAIVQPITTVANLGTWLSVQPANTAATPHAVQLNVSNLSGIGTVLQDNSTKYVSLDLSGSTFTSVTSTTGLNRSNITSITLPNTVTSIGDYSFQSASNLTSINIGSGVNSIGAGAFIQNGLTEINVDAANASYTSENGIVYNKAKTTIVAYPVKKAGATFTIPAGVTVIEGYVFSSNTQLTSITIPDGITSIGASAFSQCSELTSVIIPNSVTSLGIRAFRDCYKLASVIIGSGVTSIGDYAFQGDNQLLSVSFGRVGTTFGSLAFVDANNTTALQTAYTAGGTGTYTRPDRISSTWTKQN